MNEGYLPLFSIRDSKALTFAAPFSSANADTAVRSVRQALKDPNHPLAMSAEDYALYALGEWDDTSGDLVPHPPTMLVGLADLLEKE